MNRVYIAKIPETGIEESDIQSALAWLNWDEIIPENARVFIKPNLTWPVHMPGVTTTPKAIESLVAVLRKRTKYISVGESDGGYHSYDAEETFRGHNLNELQEKYGIHVVNLTDEPSETHTMIIAGQAVSVTLSKCLLHETDVFITMPVPKTHVMTGVSLAFKNQWGCVPSTMRLREHYAFDRKIIAINKLLHPKLTILDGTYFLDGAGPMTGDVIPMHLLIAGDDPGATSAVACQVMGINPMSIRHQRIARREQMFPKSIREITLNTQIEPFISHRFQMKRAFLDYVSLVGFRSRFFTYLFWESALAGPLHKFLFAVRRNLLIQRFLYGKAGMPPEPKAVQPAGIK